MESISLATRLRPQTLEDFIGQKHLLGEGKILNRIIKSKKIPSLIFFGQAGTGKTSLGFILAKSICADFIYLNASFTNVAEIKKISLFARKKFEKEKKSSVLFLDEIHKFNKAQQEYLVPETERSTLILIGATIYNPYYYLIPSLLSRSVICEFKPLSKEEIIFLLNNALKDKILCDLKIEANDDFLDYLATQAGGDARKALNSLELAIFSTSPCDGLIRLDKKVAEEVIQKNIFYDKKDSYHYDTISAFIKSVRGSDVESSLYWLVKMLKSGEDPRFIARRLVILASEDIGNANPFALVLATSCFKAVEFVGMPEAEIILAQTTIYLATSFKSNASYEALLRAKNFLSKEENKEVPSHLKTTAKNYLSPHKFGGYIEQDYGIKEKFYFPKEIGEEKKIKDFLNLLKKKEKT